MYNRYIPQPDGTYRRSRVRDEAPQRPVQRTSPPRPDPEPEVPCPPPPEPHAQEQPKTSQNCPRARQRPPRQTQPSKQENNTDSASGFLKNLLPKDFDTSDLMIVLLLLLMAGDSSEDKSTALLTLALYFFM